MPRVQREQMILDVAGQVFARGGYHAGSMDEIAELADVSKPMVYAYFGSKDGLYTAYIDRTGGQLLDRLVAAADRSDPPLKALEARTLEFLAFVEEHRDGWRVLFSEISASRPLADHVASLRAQIAAAVSRMIDETVQPLFPLPPPASDAIAHAIVGAGESLANWWLAHPEISREQVAEWYVGIVQAATAAAVKRTHSPGAVRSPAAARARPSATPSARRRDGPPAAPPA